MERRSEGASQEAQLRFPSDVTPRTGEHINKVSCIQPSMSPWENNRSGEEAFGIDTGCDGTPQTKWGTMHARRNLYQPVRVQRDVERINPKRLEQGSKANISSSLFCPALDTQQSIAWSEVRELNSAQRSYAR